MTVEQLIAHLQKCNPKFEVRILEYTCGNPVEFVELQNQTHTVLLRGDIPNWKHEEEYDGISITATHQEDGFASTSWE